MDFLTSSTLAAALGTLMISTVAGSGGEGYNGDNQLATATWLNLPHGIAFDASGALLLQIE